MPPVSVYLKKAMPFIVWLYMSPEQVCHSNVGMDLPNNKVSQYMEFPAERGGGQDLHTPKLMHIEQRS